MKDNVTQLPTASNISDEAIKWLAEIDRGTTKKREHELQEWLSKSEKHKDAFLEVVSLWGELDSLSQLSDIFPHKDVSKKKSTFKYIYHLAASILLFVSFSMLYFFSIDNVQDEYKELVATYRTQVGEDSTIELPDTSILKLNTNTEVTVEYSNSQRNIMLKYGEVHIDVAHDVNRKLIVMAGGKAIEAVGTAFNVEYFNQVDIELLVTDGTVRVFDTNMAVNSSVKKSIFENIQDLISIPTSNKEIAVTAGQKVSLTVNNKIEANKIEIESINDAIDTQLSWLNGRLIFKGESMQQEIGRYSPWQFELRGEKIRNMQIFGRFQTGDTDALLATLYENFNINAEHTSDKTIVLTASDRDN